VSRSPAPADAALIASFGAHHVVERGDGMAAAVRALYTDGVDAVIDAALLGPDVLPASRAADAHRRLEAGGVRGRLVLTF
jgi:NADPH:quinone reductase